MSRECASYLDTMVGYATRFQPAHFLHKFSLRFLPICKVDRCTVLKQSLETKLGFFHHGIEIYIHMTTRAVECRLRSKCSKTVGLSYLSVKRRCEWFALYRYNPIRPFKSSDNRSTILLMLNTIERFLPLGLITDCKNVHKPLHSGFLPDHSSLT